MNQNQPISNKGSVGLIPIVEANMHKRKKQVCDSWRMDETYIKVGGKDRYLYRAVDKYGNTVDFLLTKRRMKGSAQKFLNKAIGHNGKPRIINIDKSGANSAGIRTVNKWDLSVKKIKIRRVKYLNNIVEQDHRHIKRRIMITTGFKEFESIVVLLRREGWPDNHKRVYRICREEGLNLRSNRPRRSRSAVHRQPSDGTSGNADQQINHNSNEISPHLQE